MQSFDSFHSRPFLPESAKRDSHQHTLNVPTVVSSEALSTTTRQEANIAFFLQIAENTVVLLPRLLSTLYHPHNIYAIHFDLKIPSTDVEKAVSSIRANATYDDNVHIMESDLITYRGISMLLNTINAMRLLSEVHPSWDYFINLSGADYPLQSPQSLRNIMGQSLGLNFFTFAPKRTWDAMAENRLSELWFDESLAFHQLPTLHKLSKLRLRNPLVDARHFTVSHAEAWMITSRTFCEFVVRSHMSRKLLAAFAYAVDASEHFFATLAWNQPMFRESIVPHSLRFIIWKHNGVLSGQHPYMVDATDESGAFKFLRHVNSTVLLFARKFEQVDSSLMDVIDARAQMPDVVLRASQHVVRKIESKNLRLAEL